MVLDGEEILLRIGSEKFHSEDYKNKLSELYTEALYFAIKCISDKPLTRISRIEHVLGKWGKNPIIIYEAIVK
jgi:hypothetical protein